MRYLFGFLCVCALWLVPLVGCSDDAPGGCQSNAECDDQNECTDDRCVDGSCDHIPVSYGTPCQFGSLDPTSCSQEHRICVSGVCENNPCDDGNECTEDSYVRLTSDCMHSPCDGFFACDWNGEPGYCTNGVCTEDPCKGVDCGDGDLCTDAFCDYQDGTCRTRARCSAPECWDAWCNPANGECVVTPQVGTRCGNCGQGECVDGVCRCTCGNIFCCLCI